MHVLNKLKIHTFMKQVLKRIQSSINALFTADYLRAQLYLKIGDGKRRHKHSI